jgi:hypothetical protein
MKEWKIKQEIFHRLNKKYDDDLKLFDIEVTKNIVEKALEYFVNDEMGWVYPSKSYVVAICYAKWISQDFNEDFYDVLNDENLLAKNDPYFLPYEKSKKIYDEIIEEMGFSYDETKGIIPDIRKYYEQEILWN